MPCTLLIGIDASRATGAQRTGTENYSLQLIRALLRQESEHRWRLYTNGPPPDGLFETRAHVGVGAHVGGGTERSESRPYATGASVGAGLRARPRPDIRSLRFPRLWTHIRLSGEMLALPPDVLFVPADVLPLIHPRRSVVTVHDLGYLSYPEAHQAAARRYLDWSTRWNAAQAAAVLADSQATKDDLVRAYGADSGRVHVVYLGRDEALRPERDPVALAAVRGHYGLAERYLLYVGTLQPRKNLGRLIKAFARLVGGPAGAGSLAGVQLVLAGRQGWHYDDLFSQVMRLGLAGRVHFPGYVADADLAALYSGALAYVLPSLYEGFGMPVLEAQACGVPVMTSNNSSLPEVAGDGALLVDPHDVDAIAAAMARLAADPELRAALVERGLANVQRFSWEKCARETLAVLEQVGNTKRRR